MACISKSSLAFTYILSSIWLFQPLIISEGRFKTQIWKQEQLSVHLLLFVIENINSILSLLSSTAICNGGEGVKGDKEKIVLY